MRPRCGQTWFLVPLSKKTGTKDVPLKTSGHEKVRITVCLTARGDGRKLKPFIVFAAAKRESKALREEFKSQCSISSSGNGWMNEELTLRWVKEILGRFSFNKRLLAWDTYECHMTDNVKQRLKDYKIDSVLIPGGCTKYFRHQMSVGTSRSRDWSPKNMTNGLRMVSMNTQRQRT